MPSPVSRDVLSLVSSHSEGEANGEISEAQALALFQSTVTASSPSSSGVKTRAVPSLAEIALASFNKTLDSLVMPLPSAATCAFITNDLHQPIASLGKGKGKKKSGGKLMTSRKKKDRPYPKKNDEETDDEDGLEDDRIMALLEAGASPEVIDKLYCIDGMSARDVERHCGGFRRPNALDKL